VRARSPVNDQWTTSSSKIIDHLTVIIIEVVLLWRNSDVWNRVVADAWWCTRVIMWVLLFGLPCTYAFWRSPCVFGCFHPLLCAPVPCISGVFFWHSLFLWVWFRGSLCNNPNRTQTCWSCPTDTQHRFVPARYFFPNIFQMHGSQFKLDTCGPDHRHETMLDNYVWSLNASIRAWTARRKQSTSSFSASSPATSACLYNYSITVIHQLYFGSKYHIDCW